MSNFKTCPHCSGAGTIYHCDISQDTGKQWLQSCPVCNGVGIILVNEKSKEESPMLAWNDMNKNTPTKTTNYICRCISPGVSGVPVETYQILNYHTLFGWDTQDKIVTHWAEFNKVETNGSLY